MLNKYQYCGHGFRHGTHRLDLVCTNLEKGGFSGGNGRGGTLFMLSNFIYISLKGISRGKSCSWFLW
jgi:hypothetical protein